MFRLAYLLMFLLVFAFPVYAECAGTGFVGVPGLTKGRILADGTITGFAKMNINIDGYSRAYHPKNKSAGALIHLCNAGKVYLPDGSSYQGSKDDKTCTGRFMKDVARIGENGWRNPEVGIVNWFGILGVGEVEIAGKKVKNVEPVFQKDGSGFLVSPTAFTDKSIERADDQKKYLNPLRIPAAVIPNREQLTSRGIVMGSFGVAIHKTERIPVPFVVGDFGPRVGEGTPALARLAAGLSPTENVTVSNRFLGRVAEKDVLWVFFGNQIPAVTYDSKNEGALLSASQAAFEKWGGASKLMDCLN
jgi:hypothetical protein